MSDGLHEMSAECSCYRGAVLLMLLHLQCHDNTASRGTHLILPLFHFSTPASKFQCCKTSQRCRWAYPSLGSIHCTVITEKIALWMLMLSPAALTLSEWMSPRLGELSRPPVLSAHVTKPSRHHHTFTLLSHSVTVVICYHRKSLIQKKM